MTSRLINKDNDNLLIEWEDAITAQEKFKKDNNG